MTFDKSIKKPQNLSKPVVNLNNEVLNGHTVVSTLKTEEFYEFESGSVKGPYDFSIQYDVNQNKLVFSAPDNNFNTQNWTLSLTENYYWQLDKIVEKDKCFNAVNDSTVRAEGKLLYDYIQNNILIADNYLGNLSHSIFHSSRLFYFKCRDNKIESLHSCPSGTILNHKVKCEAIHNCTNQPDNLKFPDMNSKFRYFECIQEKTVSKICPAGELFEYDTCIAPTNICAVQPDAYVKDINRTTFMKCVNGQPQIFNCPPNMYALNGNCENEVCENVHQGMVPIKIDNGSFEYALRYGECVKGQLSQIFECPENWDSHLTNVNILHLPQVFDPMANACTKPILCENVKLTDPNVIIPQYAFAKYLKNWSFAHLFDLVRGYKCDANDNRIEVTLQPGELILNFQKTKIVSKRYGKIPTLNPAVYFDTASQMTHTCPQNSFFNGVECQMKIPNAFTFRHLDIFKMDNLYINEWMLPRVSEIASTTVVCDPDFQPMDFINACVHKKCFPYQFLHQVRGSIKIDNRYECVRIGSDIVKHEYRNPLNLELEFWNQRLAVNPEDLCTFGTKIKTGNFVLDSTIYMTCDRQQPFVFCPSSLTETIQDISGIYACLPKDAVYESTIPSQLKIQLYLNEILNISIPENSNVTINTVTFFYNVNTTLTVEEMKRKFQVQNVFCDFESDNTAIVHFKKLPTNPENTYLENRSLRTVQSGVYDVVFDRNAHHVMPIQYELDYGIPLLSY